MQKLVGSQMIYSQDKFILVLTAVVGQKFYQTNIAPPNPTLHRVHIELNVLMFEHFGSSSILLARTSQQPEYGIQISTIVTKLG